jgi:diguanylate cyclase (GGDEF)-like protein
MVIAENIRRNVSTTMIPCADGTQTYVTLSIGVNSMRPDKSISCELFISEADKALYRAKKDGRNRVCRADENIMKREGACDEKEQRSRCG